MPIETTETVEDRMREYGSVCYYAVPCSNYSRNMESPTCEKFMCKKCSAFSMYSEE